MNLEQRQLFEASTGITPEGLYFIIGGLIVALFGIITIKILKGTMKGWAKEEITAYVVGSRTVRLILLFNILIFISTV